MNSTLLKIWTLSYSIKVVQFCSGSQLSYYWILWVCRTCFHSLWGWVSVLNLVLGQSTLSLTPGPSVIWTEYSKCSARFRHSSPSTCSTTGFMESWRRTPFSGDKTCKFEVLHQLQTSVSSTHQSICLHLRSNSLCHHVERGSMLWKTVVSSYRFLSLKDHSSTLPAIQYPQTIP